MAQGKKEKVEKSVKYWHNSALDDFRAAESLFEKKLYPQSLFFCHLTVEKLLKALVIEKTREPAPYIHDLRRLAEIAGINLDEDKEKVLEKIFTFNISGRYQQEKIEFHRQYNKREYAQKYLEITKGLILWLEKKFQKKQ